MRPDQPEVEHDEIEETGFKPTIFINPIFSFPNKKKEQLRKFPSILSYSSLVLEILFGFFSNFSFWKPEGDLGSNIH